MREEIPCPSIFFRVDDMHARAREGRLRGRLWKGCDVRPGTENASREIERSGLKSSSQPLDGVIGYSPDRICFQREPGRRRATWERWHTHSIIVQQPIHDPVHVRRVSNEMDDLIPDRNDDNFAFGRSGLVQRSQGGERDMNRDK